MMCIIIGKLDAALKKRKLGFITYFGRTATTKRSEIYRIPKKSTWYNMMNTSKSL